MTTCADCGTPIFNDSDSHPPSPAGPWADVETTDYDCPASFDCLHHPQRPAKRPKPRPGVIPSPKGGSPVSVQHSASLGPCLWFALCDRPGTRLVPHPAFPGGVPTCERCYERSQR